MRMILPWAEQAFTLASPDHHPSTMARIRPNSALGAISGTLDGYVFKSYRGKTVISKRPKFTKPWTKAQVATRKTFKAASDFSKTIKADGILRELYKKRGRRLRLNYRQMALRDAFNAPTIHDLDLAKFTPARGGTLAITASDDFEVTGVSVTVYDSGRRTVARGEASLANAVWRFTVPAPVSAAERAFSAEVAARDRPGNVTSRVFPLE